MIPDRLDERSLRRPEFQPGVAIVLSDGQGWHFPTPRFADLYPALDRAGHPELRRGFDVGPEYDALFNAYVDADEVAAEIAILAVMAHRLLARNYDLAFGDMRLLLRVKLDGDPEQGANQEMWRDLADHCTGNGKKTTPVGSSPS